MCNCALSTEHRAITTHFAKPSTEGWVRGLYMEKRKYISYINVPGVECPDCGSLVRNPKKHDEWHEKLDQPDPFGLMKNIAKEVGL